MKLSHLKKIRIAVSLLFFASLLLLFLDFKNALSPAYTNYFTYLQFIPSLIKYISVFGIAAAGFIFILALTVLFGRVYCSTICPVGTLQDLIIYAIKKLNRKKHHKYLKPNYSVRYGFMAAAIIFFLSGSLFAVNLLDPYSNFGRLVTQIFKPLLLLLNNAAASLLEMMNVYSVYPIEIKTFNFLYLIVPVIFLSVILWLTLKKGRLFCNTVCPVGALLGLVSRFSLFKISIDQDNCRSCNLCERVCKAGCIDKKNKDVDFSRCVGCYNCFTVCPSEGIVFSSSFSQSKSVKKTETDFVRRDFLIQIAAGITALAGTAFGQKKIVPKKPSTIVTGSKYPVSPPGSIGLQHFTDSCTACHLCVSACPTQVLQPSFLEYGFLGMMQPRMDYNTAFCDFECVICTQVCPSGAILPAQLDSKKVLQLGKAKFEKDNCVVYTEKTDCGACAEHCPTKAVTMVPHENLKAPEVKDEFCIGCGACEFACPTKPYKAIFVESNQVHLKAEKKKVEKTEKKVDYQEDFPF